MFCKIVKGEIPSTKVYEDGDIIAFMDIHPAAPVHVLVVPKKHIRNLASVKDSDEKILGKVQIVASRLSKKLGIGEAFRLLMANGEFAGQTVQHLHYHLVGGWKEKTTEKDFKKESAPGGLRQ